MSLERQIRGPLTAEIENIGSPIRRFLDERFAPGLRDLQRRYREEAPPLVIPPGNSQEANPGTVGTAADWLMRFLLCPQPSLHLAANGAALCRQGAGMPAALEDLAMSLGVGPGSPRSADDGGFTGPVL